MVAYLEKLAENADFAEIVNFLNDNPIRKTKRKATEISQSGGPTTLVADETVYEKRGDIVERAATTIARLDAEQDSGFENYSSKEESQEVGKEEKDAEIQGRYGHDIEINNASTSITTTSINITTAEPVTTISAPITTAGVSVSTAEPSTPPTTTTTIIEDKDLIIVQTLMKMRKEERMARQKEEDANIAEWDDVQAMMDADHELAKRLQAEEQGELSIKERSKLFVELMNQRKKHFARLRVEEKRRKPPTKAQKRNQMCNYLKNMVGFTHNLLKNKSFEEVQKAFDMTMSWINSFVPMDKEVVKGSGKKAESSGKEAIIRFDGSTKYYKIFSAMLDDFDRQDVLDLYRLEYPLIQEMLSRMLNGRIEVDHEYEMAYDLI
nr:hypothetical protein [Tanacetum cinerariifolium]